MNFKSIFKNSFLEAFAQNEVSAGEVTVILLSTCVIALYIFLVYRMITRKTFYSKNFNISLAALSLRGFCHRKPVQYENECRQDKGADDCDLQRHPQRFPDVP